MNFLLIGFSTIVFFYRKKTPLGSKNIDGSKLIKEPSSEVPDVSSKGLICMKPVVKRTVFDNKSTRNGKGLEEKSSREELENILAGLKLQSTEREKERKEAQEKKLIKLLVFI